MSEWHRKLIPGRYFNSNGHAVAIVAVVNYCQARLFDWSCYIHGTDLVWHEEDAYKDAAENGSKMPKHDAVYFFPDLPANLWRR